MTLFCGVACPPVFVYIYIYIYICVCVCIFVPMCMFVCEPAAHHKQVAGEVGALKVVCSWLEKEFCEALPISALQVLLPLCVGYGRMLHFPY